MKKCPYCAEDIQDAAIVCRYCGRDLPTVTPPKIEGRQQQPGCLTIYFTNVFRRLVWLFLIGGIMYVVSWAQGYQTPSPTRTIVPQTPFVATMIAQSRSTATPRPTNTQRPANSTRLSTPTPQTQCYRWDEIGASMAGQEICAYGVVTRYDENWEYELTYFYFGDGDTFFLVSSYRWDDSVEGNCIAAEGRVSLNTYETPFIDVKEIYACE